ncbi:MAG: redoxin domain-containing protein, partial [Solirubrobacterales bacterium]|nr:redoxin domain-containing protein [Solirubrobacterales bacterium]
MTTTTTTAGELELAGRRCQLTVSPQTPEQSLTSAERKALEFPVLSDAGNAVARRYGLVFTQSEAATACATTHRPLQATGGDHRRHAHRGCRAGADDRHRTRQAPRLVQIVSHDGRIRPMARPSTIVAAHGPLAGKSGLGSALINTSRLSGGALGPAILVTITHAAGHDTRAGS